MNWVAPGVVAAILCAAVAHAERLPLKHYSTADGLAQDRVRCIVPDARGFLWFCTPAGLSRFDGRQFITYTAADGLPRTSINHVLATPSGALWIATNGGGVARFDGRDAAQGSSGRPVARFTLFPVGTEPQTGRVNVLRKDADGRLWAGTDGGLFVLDEPGGEAAFRRVALNVPGVPDDEMEVWSLADAPDGALWIGMTNGLVQRHADARTIHYAIDPMAGIDHVWCLLRAGDGRLWIGHDRGLMVVEPASLSKDARGRLRGVSYGTIDGLPSPQVRALLADADGRIWVGTNRGLVEFDGRRFRSYSTAEGLLDELVRTLAADADGNIWLATAGGVMRFVKNGFTTYGTADGLGDSLVRTILETPDGHLCVVGRNGVISCLDGRRFDAAAPEYLASTPQSNLGYGFALRDHTGEWWVPISSVLYRLPRVKRVSELRRANPIAVYTSRDGLASEMIYRLFEDSSGDIWIGSAQPTRNGLVTWRRATGRFERHAEADALPRFHAAHVFAEAPHGTVWIGFWEGGLARYRGGRFTVLNEHDGVPAGEIQSMHVDRRGALWIGSDQGGAARVEDPAADRPRFESYTTANGLSGNNVLCIVDDREGRFYFGTPRGLDQLDPRTGRVRHYTTADGLAHDEVLSAFRDRTGALWFGSWRGLSRLVPAVAAPADAPTIVIGRLTLGGEPVPLSDWGARSAALKLGPEQTQVQIEFFGLPFNQGERLTYQHKLDGVEREWSRPSGERSINYARLAPGSYRFLVRAVNGDGLASIEPAEVSITILPPVWARGWFLMLAGVSTAGLVFALYRYRLAQAIALERVRTRIATDLHDDIGSSLSQIAILSEVAQQRAGGGGAPIVEPLASIASTSRALVDSMSDIVWAINPSRDALRDLVQRMRRFASDALTARTIEFTFDADGADELSIRLDAAVRQHVLLVFKELVNNIVRHSRCRTATIALRVEHDRLVLTVADDGRGFDAAAGHEGQGIASMRRRAREVGGVIDFVSTAGRGSLVTLTVPLVRRPFALAWRATRPRSAAVRDREYPASRSS